MCDIFWGRNFICLTYSFSDSVPHNIKRNIFQLKIAVNIVSFEKVKTSVQASTIVIFTEFYFFIINNIMFALRCSKDRIGPREENNTEQFSFLIFLSKSFDNRKDFWLVFVCLCVFSISRKKFTLPVCYLRWHCFLGTVPKRRAVSLFQ